LSSSCIDANSKDHKSNDSQDFDAGKVELDLSVEGDREEIEHGDDGPESTNENTNVEAGIPVLNDQAAGSQLQSICHGPREPVDPTHGKSETGVDEAGCVCCEGARNRQEGGHFTKGDHDAVHECTDKGVCDQCTGGSSILECAS
jgi:hypothetical protein